MGKFYPIPNIVLEEYYRTTMKQAYKKNEFLTSSLCEAIIKITI
jgi:hypothetical protein